MHLSHLFCLVCKLGAVEQVGVGRAHAQCSWGCSSSRIDATLEATQLLSEEDLGTGWNCRFQFPLYFLYIFRSTLLIYAGLRLL